MAIHTASRELIGSYQGIQDRAQDLEVLGTRKVHASSVGVVWYVVIDLTRVDCTNGRCHRDPQAKGKLV